MKKSLIGAIVIGIGLSFIFGYASHSVWGGIIVGISYIMGFIISYIIKK